MTLNQSTLAEVERVLRTMSEVVSSRPGYVYPKSPKGSCDYVRINPQTQLPEVSCLVGQVLHKLGVSLDALSEREATGCDQFTDLVVPSFGRPLGRLSLYVLRQAQVVQDNGQTWDEALRTARAAYRAIAEGSLT